MQTGNASPPTIGVKATAVEEREPAKLRATDGRGFRGWTTLAPAK
jgi:hypothetical protein